MTRKPQRSGLTLVAAGLIGILFFWATDPRYGLVARSIAPENLVDAANQAFIPTIAGIAGSAIVLCIGLWLLSRRPV